MEFLYFKKIEISGLRISRGLRGSIWDVWEGNIILLLAKFRGKYFIGTFIRFKKNVFLDLKILLEFWYFCFKRTRLFFVYNIDIFVFWKGKNNLYYEE